MKKFFAVFCAALMLLGNCTSLAEAINVEGLPILETTQSFTITAKEPLSGAPYRRLERAQVRRNLAAGLGGCTKRGARSGGTDGAR